jgi:hypothetical protein
VGTVTALIAGEHEAACLVTHVDNVARGQEKKIPTVSTVLNSTAQGFVTALKTTATAVSSIFSRFSRSHKKDIEQVSGTEETTKKISLENAGKACVHETRAVHEPLIDETVPESGSMSIG